MSRTLSEFTRKKNYLLCVDSDGCAMDTMNVKHVKCFGPCFVDEWQIEKPEKVLKRWNEINLYSLTRGINRFKGLAQMLCELYPNNPEYAEFKAWTGKAEELSERSLEGEIKKGGGEVFEKALAWSRATNRAIDSLPDEEKSAFDGVYDALNRAKVEFDIAVVSSANPAAVTEEWRRCGLIDLTDCIATQKDGNKAFCISQLVEKGYKRENVVMVGDAMGDLRAAEENGVNFYPILVNKEVESWRHINDCLARFLRGCPIELSQKFVDNLS